MKNTTPKEVREAIEGAASIIQKGWTQYTQARDKEGAYIGNADPEAVCFCPLGSLYRFLYLKEGKQGASVGPSLLTEKSLNVLGEALATLELSTPGQITLAAYNDTPGRTRAEMVALFKQAV